jgi:hypothetical protein
MAGGQEIESMAPVTLETLFDTYAAASLEKQLALESAVGEASWSLNLDTRELRFSNGQVFQVQLLGTESEHAATWLWGWANRSIDNPETLTAAEALRTYGAQQGVAELVEAELSLDRVNGHLLSMIAAGLCRGDAYYRAPYEGGAAFLLLEGPHLRELAGDSPVHLNQVFMQLISAMDCGHRPAFEAYIRYKGYDFHETSRSIRARSPDGEPLTATFDEQGRLTELQFGVTAVPEPKVPERPWWKLGK